MVRDHEHIGSAPITSEKVSAIVKFSMEARSIAEDMLARQAGAKNDSFI